ncbi:unnamed protein product, partial [Adineta steineri]
LSAPSLVFFIGNSNLHDENKPSIEVFEASTANTPRAIEAINENNF